MTADKIYTVVVRLTVHDDTDEHLQNVQAIQDEFQTWLGGLRATVTVTVHPTDEHEVSR